MEIVSAAKRKDVEQTDVEMESQMQMKKGADDVFDRC